MGAQTATASGEQRARVGRLRLCYETFGDAGNPPVLLVMGLGSQMILWDEEFCELLASRGFRVIRFDNRDVGRSTILTRCPGRQALAAGRLATRVARPTRSPTWPVTPSDCSITWGSPRRTSSASRWAA